MSAAASAHAHGPAQYQDVTAEVTRANREHVAPGAQLGAAVQVEGAGLRAAHRAEAGRDDALAAREAVAGAGLGAGRPGLGREDQLAGLLGLLGLVALDLEG